MSQQDSDTDDQQLIATETNFWDEAYTKTSLSIQSDPNYHINKNKYFGIFRGYIRQDWDTLNIEHGLEEQRAEWIELFFDLIYVACIVHISHEAVYSIPSHNHDVHRRLEETHSESAIDCTHRGDYDFIMTCFAQFGLLTLFWMEQTMIETHFVLNQMMDMVIRVFFMILVLSAGLFIHDDPSYHFAFQISCIGLKIICVLIYVKAAMIPRAKIHAMWHIFTCSLIIIALIIITAFYEGCAINYFVIYSVLFVVEYIFNIIEWTIPNKQTGQLKLALPLHVAHISERFGLFVMLILGEAIISLITIDMGQGSLTTQSLLDVSFIIGTFVMAFVIAILYFDAQPSEEDIMHGQYNHALRTTKIARLFYIWGHHQLFFGLLAFGIGIKVAAKHFFDNITKREWIDIILPAYGLVVIIIALVIIRLVHPQKVKNRLIWVARFAILCALCIVPIFAVSINQSIIFSIVFILLMLLLVLDVEGHSKRKKKKSELKEKREKHARERSEEISRLKTDSEMSDQ